MIHFSEETFVLFQYNVHLAEIPHKVGFLKAVSAR